jgi:ABC-type nitrate/sulfonate/bicarbonate transport system substrate-binding protein
VNPFFSTTSRHRLAVAGLLAAVVALAGCSSSGSHSSSGSGSTAAASGTPNYGAITVELSWVKDVEFAGEYIADSQGYYKAAGFSSVNFVAGPGATETLVASNKALIGISDGVTAGTAVANTQAPLKIIGTTYQKNPFTITSLANKADITTPQGLIGKRIGIQSGNTTLFKAFLAVNNIPASKVTIVPVQYDPSVLTDGQVDGYLAFLTDEDIALKQQGYQLANLPFADNGLAFVADSIEVSQDSIKNHRAELEAFLEATIKGWKQAVATPQTGVDLAVNNYGKSLKLDAATELLEAQQAVSLISTSDTTQNGLMTISPSLISANIATLKASGVTISSSDLFDMSLIQDVYKQHPDLLK